ncbi:hypothetical protein GUJ93_ZPchr0010g9045 [Zizania palustris]|uniref:Uncharacterized protein n=1 Tax=Zizania palustris TaxID=103762 RepID=A0A8J6BFA9_ZIZPA|nr:hypothetical protein GUJ93_ZPchr0010g9045 [Zizania palustris]
MAAKECDEAPGEAWAEEPPGARRDNRDLAHDSVSKRVHTWERQGPRIRPGRAAASTDRTARAVRLAAGSRQQAAKTAVGAAVLDHSASTMLICTTKMMRLLLVDEAKMTTEKKKNEFVAHFSLIHVES